MKSLVDIDFNAKGGAKKSNEIIDYSASAEPTLNTPKEDTLKGHLSYLAKAVKWIKGQFAKYLPLTGGTMTGAINMNKNPLNNAGFEVVTALPTTNLFVGRKVVMNGIEYTYNGNLWTSQLDPLQKFSNNTYGINTLLTTLNANSYEVQLANSQISQIPQLLANNSTSLIDNVLQSNEYVYERMDNGTTEWVETSNKSLCLGDKLRFTAWKNWETNVRGLAVTTPGSINYIGISINARFYKMKVTIEYLTYTNNLGDADVNNSANYTWWKVYEKEFPEQKTTWIFPLQRSIYPSALEGGIYGRYYIQNVRVTIESITAGTDASAYFIPSVNIYTSKQITLKTVPININYDAVIKPTQTTTTYKTNSWILQYLIQGINWLMNNKIETNSNAILRTLNIKGSANSTALIESDANSLITRLGGRGSDAQFVIKSNAIRPGSTITNTIELGNTDSYWKSVRAGKYIVPNGTSSQFLKADGSVDSTRYYSKPSTGIPETDLASAVQVSLDKANTAYGWGNHVNAGYAKTSDIPTELPPTNNSVTTAKIADNSVSTSKIQDKAIIGSKIGQEEITTNHIANSAITNAKLAKSSMVINGTPIALGGIGQILGLVTANENRCFLEIANNELILSKPTFAGNGSILNIEEIVRYPLLTELPTIPNPTANATEITDVNHWFNSNINSYIIPKDLMYNVLTNNIPMTQLLLPLNGASCTLTSYNLDFKREGIDMNKLISDLTTNDSYEVYVENDIDSITTSSICTLKFKIDDHQVIIECYKKTTV
jgi:hypothetical protein